MEMGAAGDVEIEAVGALQRHERRVAVAPVGQRLEQGLVRGRIGREDIQRRADRARFRDALPLAQADPFGFPVEEGEPHGIVAAAGEGDRRMLRTPP